MWRGIREPRDVPGFKYDTRWALADMANLLLQAPKDLVAAVLSQIPVTINTQRGLSPWWDWEEQVPFKMRTKELAHVSTMTPTHHGSMLRHRLQPPGGWPFPAPAQCMHIVQTREPYLEFPDWLQKRLRYMIQDQPPPRRLCKIKITTSIAIKYQMEWENIYSHTPYEEAWEEGTGRGQSTGLAHQTGASQFEEQPHTGEGTEVTPIIPPVPRIPTHMETEEDLAARREQADTRKKKAISVDLDQSSDEEVESSQQRSPSRSDRTEEQLTQESATGRAVTPPPRSPRIPEATTQMARTTRAARVSPTRRRRQAQPDPMDFTWFTGASSAATSGASSTSRYPTEDRPGGVEGRLDPAEKAIIESLGKQATYVQVQRALQAYRQSVYREIMAKARETVQQRETEKRQQEQPATRGTRRQERLQPAGHGPRAHRGSASGQTTSTSRQQQQQQGELEPLILPRGPFPLMSTKGPGVETTLEQQLQREYTARRGETTRMPGQQIKSEVHIPRARGPQGSATSTTQQRQHVSMASRASPTGRRGRASSPTDHRYHSLEMGRGRQQQQQQQQYKRRGGAHLESGTADIPRRSPKRQRPHYEQTSDSPMMKRRDTTRRGHRSPSQSPNGQSSWTARAKR